MKPFLFIVCFLISFVNFSQDSFTESDAKAIIDTFFEGFHKGDTLMMRSVMAAEVVMQTAFTNKEGGHELKTESADKLLTAIANRTEDQKWEERLLDYYIQFDGNLAQVWTPYEFWFNDGFSHCGANAFTMVKTNEGWKIIHLIDSRRRSSCNQ